MSQASLSKAKKKHQQMFSSGEMDRGPGANKSTNSSLSKFTPHYSTRSAGTLHVAAPYKDAILKTNDKITMVTQASKLFEPWMEMVTPGKFIEFQQAIFTIDENIVSKPENANHHFTKQWIKLCQAKNPMTATTSWNTIKNISLADFFTYKDFLQQCPSITTRVQFAPNGTTKQGFDYGIFEPTAATTS